MPLELTVATPDGPARAWLHRGPGGAEVPGVVFLPDAFGVRPALHEMAARLAGLGYAVLLPDVYHREGAVPPFDIATTWTTPAERARIMALIATLDAGRVGRDFGAWLDALDAQPGVHPGGAGVVGYCMGGRHAFLAAALHPDRVKAAAAFHAGWIVKDGDDSPHLLAGRVKAAVYLGAADDDRSCSPEHQGTLASALGRAGVRYALELYAGKKHGFAVPDNAGAYDPAAAAQHWRRLEAFLGEHLGAV
ncbi:MAG: dienelactone hydrolase family protein [Anaeromyxobacteraceae bacterium]